MTHATFDRPLYCLCHLGRCRLGTPKKSSLPLFQEVSHKAIASYSSYSVRTLRCYLRNNARSTSEHLVQSLLTRIAVTNTQNRGVKPYPVRPRNAVEGRPWMKRKTVVARPWVDKQWRQVVEPKPWVAYFYGSGESQAGMDAALPRLGTCVENQVNCKGS
jgi:hypothetical protein